MKIKRLKHVRKTLVFFRNNFDFESPYTVLVDGTFCRAALKFKVNIGEQLPKYLDSEVQLCTTQCVLAECEALGPLLYGPFKVLQQYKVAQCHHKDPIPAIKCLHAMARRRHHKYFMATQDQELSKQVRQLAGVPLLFIAFNAINLEAPSDKARRKASTKLDKKLAPSSTQQENIDSLKKAVFGEIEEVKKKKRKGPKGKNPLSCKKKTAGSTSKKKKRKKFQEKKLGERSGTEQSDSHSTSIS